MKTLCLTDGPLRFTINLEALPNDGQFAQASAEAQSLTLISVLPLTFDNLGYAVRTLSSLSRNLRRKLFAARSELSLAAYPALRLSGAPKDAESLLWEWAKPALAISSESRLTKTERKIAVLNSVRKIGNGQYQEVSQAQTQKSQKQEFEEKRKQGKALLGSILSIHLEGQITLSDNLLAALKEIMRGDNLASCNRALRSKICEALRKFTFMECQSLASLIEEAHDPYYGKALAIELDSLSFELAREQETKPMTLAERIAAKRARKELQS